jgi:hypothetical protein
MNVEHMFMDGEREAAQTMLERVEQLLQAGDRAGAVAVWKALQKAHPDYPIPDSTREQLEAFARTER